MLTPSRVHTDATAATLHRIPLTGSATPSEVLARLEGERLPFALTGSWAGGGAILGSEPLAVAGPDEDPFTVVDELPAVAGSDRPAGAGRGPVGGGTDAGPDPVGGGWFGWLGYRLGSRIERLPPGPPRPHPMPDFHLAYYDHVLRRDPGGTWWFEALATPEREAALAARLEHLRALVVTAPPRPNGPRPSSPRPASRGCPGPRPAPLTLAPGDATHHLDAVADGVRRIAAGEIFQANLCLALRSRTERTATQLYAEALTRAAPAYGAAFTTPAGGIASLSPELFLRRRGREVVTAPIKGTAPRPADPAAAERARAALRGSLKDAAEHVMIVDLMRNDLGRVCVYGMVTAEREPTAEPHPGLWHLVSRVRGRLRPEVGDGQLLRATFPPGSVTGAPKVQAMHVIAALEPAGREVYTGAIGFASPLAGLELNVAIRTLELRDGAMWLGAGGGIVADSEPRAELEEALVKARPVAAAIGTAVLAGAEVTAGAR